MDKITRFSKVCVQSGTYLATKYMSEKIATQIYNRKPMSRRLLEQLEMKLAVAGIPSLLGHEKSLPVEYPPHMIEHDRAWCSAMTRIHYLRKKEQKRKRIEKKAVNFSKNMRADEQVLYLLSSKIRELDKEKNNLQVKFSEANRDYVKQKQRQFRLLEKTNKKLRQAIEKVK